MVAGIVAASAYEPYQMQLGTFKKLSAGLDGKLEFHCNDCSFTNLYEFTTSQSAFQNVAEIFPCFDFIIESIDFSGNSKVTI